MPNSFKPAGLNAGKLTESDNIENSYWHPLQLFMNLQITWNYKMYFHKIEFAINDANDGHI